MQQSPYGYWLPLNISTHGPEIDRLINMLHWFMALLFVGWGIYLVYVLIRFRERPSHLAQNVDKHFRFPTWLEIGIALFEVFVLVFISSPIWFKQKKDFPDEKEAVVVRVIAQQFEWHIHHPGRDGKFGRTRPELVNDTNALGLDRNDPVGKDDIEEVNNLHVPVDKPVIAQLSSKDVIHNFFLPVLRIKQDVIPGMTVPVWFQATQTSPPEDQPQYEIACAQLCGLSHYRMKGVLHIQTAENHSKWIAEQEKALQEDQQSSAEQPAGGSGQ